MKIALVYPDDHSIWLFRQGLIRELTRRGHEVCGITKPGRYVPDLEKIGMRHIPVQMERFVDPVRDLKVMWHLYRIFRRERFDVVHNFTVKPNNFGTFTAKLAGVPTILNSVTGLGYIYRQPWEKGAKVAFVKWVIRNMYWLSSRIAKRSWFQNPDDIDFFVQRGLIRRDRAVLIRSSGIDLDQWRMDEPLVTAAQTARAELGLGDEDVVIMMVSRALRSKGTFEYLEAAERLRESHPQAKFVLIGGAEEQTSLGIPAAELRAKSESGLLMWLGHRHNIRELTAAADICVLPSYYPEGVPRCMLEAMALAKPIVTTDSRGCREAVDDGINGYKVPPRDGRALADALAKLVESEEHRTTMGGAGRTKVERDFDEHYVVDRLIGELYNLPETAQPESTAKMRNVS